MHPEPVENISIGEQEIRSLKKPDVTSTKEDGDDISKTRRLDTSIDYTSSNLRASDKDQKNDPRALLRNSLFDSLLDESIRMAFCEHVENKELPVRNACAGHMLQLILHLVSSAENPEVRVERGRKVATALVAKLSKLVQGCLSSNNENKPDAKHSHILIIVSLRTLSKLMRKDNNSFQSAAISDFGKVRDALAGSSIKSKDKTDPRFVCNVQ